MFGTSKQTWWKPSPLLARKRATPVVVVGRLDEFDLGLPDPQECDPDPVIRDVHDRLEVEAERVAPQRERVLDRADDERDMVDPADAADRVGDLRRVSCCHPPSVPCRPCHPRGPRAGSSSGSRCPQRSNGSGSAGTGRRRLASRPTSRSSTRSFPGRPRSRCSPDTRRGSRPRTNRSTSGSPGSGDSRPSSTWRPSRPAPFNRLTDAMHARFPDFPPYEGAFDVVVPAPDDHRIGDGARSTTSSARRRRPSRSTDV